MNYFTKSILDFFVSNNAEGIIPNIQRLDISSDGTKKINLSMVDNFRANNIDELLMGNLCFMILDSYIDSIFPKMESENFINKYKLLPRNNNIELIFSQLYRIMLLFRNALVHHINGINRKKDMLEINFKHNKIDYELSITYKGIKTIKDMILCYFYYEHKNYSYYYKEYLYYSFFDDITKEIIKFNDKEGSIIKINSTKINRFERFNCNSIDYKTTDNIIHFDIPREFVKKNNLPIDIYITLNEKSFIIPIEVIEEKNQMDIEEVKKFMTTSCI